MLTYFLLRTGCLCLTTIYKVISNPQEVCSCELFGCQVISIVKSFGSSIGCFPYLYYILKPTVNVAGGELRKQVILFNIHGISYLICLFGTSRVPFLIPSKIYTNTGYDMVEDRQIFKHWSRLRL